MHCDLHSTDESKERGRKGDEESGMKGAKDEGKAGWGQGGME